METRERTLSFFDFRRGRNAPADRPAPAIPVTKPPAVSRRPDLLHSHTYDEPYAYSAPSYLEITDIESRTSSQRRRDVTPTHQPPGPRDYRPTAPRDYQARYPASNRAPDPYYNMSPVGGARAGPGAGSGPARYGAAVFGVTPRTENNFPPKRNGDF